MDNIKIIIVDDHPMVIEGMRAMFQQIGFVDVSATANNAFQALELVETQQPDLVITDINMSEISGFELTSKLKKDYTNVKVIGMSTFNERSYISQMIQSGADGYLVKSASKEEIEEAITSVMDGKMYLSVDINMNAQERKDIKNQPILTRRKKEILNLIADGLTNPQIAEKLFISLNTVDTRRKNLLLKLEDNNTASLVRRAIYFDLVKV